MWIYVFWHNLVDYGLYVFWHNLVDCGLYVFWYNLVDYGLYVGARGGVVIKALRYKPAGRGFDSQGVIGIFQRHNPSGRTMALGSTQPLTEMSTRCISWG